MAFPKMGKEPGTKGLANKPSAKPDPSMIQKKATPPAKPAFGKPGGRGMAIGQQPVMPKTMRKMQKMMGK